jgi:anthranilate synthase/aminodeoxychorismate synthase-like glutamine amidotransferase
MNLAQIVRETPGFACDIVRHENIRLEEIAHYAGIIFSPGPGLPREFPEMFQLLDRYAGRIPILGVCLGHQAIAEYYGAHLINLPHPQHGQRANLRIIDKHDPLLANIDHGTTVGLYHSWAVDEASLPTELAVTARSDSDLVMALRHKTLNLRGVQFHPESYMTPEGATILRNWLNLASASSASSRAASVIASSS